MSCHTHGRPTIYKQSLRIFPAGKGLANCSFTSFPVFGLSASSNLMKRNFSFFYRKKREIELHSW